MPDLNVTHVFLEALRPLIADELREIKDSFEMFRYEPVEELSGTVDIWTAISGEPPQGNASRL